ncbi:MAG TPA: hypothetical protein PL037_00040 [Elusimicrobiales bacterium]|nr:hypothetical protein [Elusimicrobiales bacterium]
MAHFAICSNPDCSGSAHFPGGAALQYAFEHPKEALNLFKSLDSLLPRARHCHKCGSLLLFLCLHCRKGVFTSPRARFCMYCGKDIKMIPESESDRRKYNRKFHGPERRQNVDRRFARRRRH